MVPARSSSGQAGDDRTAEEVFASWLQRREVDAAEDLEELCRARPAQAAALRRMHAGWQRLGPLLEGGTDAPPAAPPDAGASLRTLLAALRRRRAASARYDRRDELGSGGMGVVERVWDPDLKRELARKRARDAVPSGDELDSASLQGLGRFLEEAQITGQLDHPGIVPVHELGLDDAGHAFFTMRLVRGSDLSAVLREVAAGTGEWTQTRALSALLKACEALAYAHAKGVVHRDLKPANVMVGRFGEVYVMDWGLARVLSDPAPRDEFDEGGATTAVWTDRRGDEGSSALATADGAIVGTAAYMPPEQARGELERIGPAADVYAMGAILYELLTGAPPYGRDAAGRPDPGDAVAVWSRVRAGPPPPVARLAPHQPAELVAICERAMARRIEDRYADVRELADDLRAYLENRVVKAHRTGAVVELTKWVQRNRLTAGATAAALALAVGGLASTTWVQSSARARQEELNARLSVANEALADANDEARAQAAAAVEQRDRADTEARRAEREAEEARRSREAADGVVDYLVELFQAADPAVALGQEVTARELLARGAERLEDRAAEPALRARLASALATAYLGLGEGERAEELFQRALDVRAEMGHADHPERWRELHNRGLARSSQGRYAEGAEDLRAAYENLRRLRGEADPEALRMGATLGDCLRTAGRAAEARELLEGLRLVAEEELGPRHAATVAILGELVMLRPLQHEETEADLRRVLAYHEAELHPDHPSLGRWRNALARSLWVQQEFEEAEQLFRRVVATAERVQGPAHPDTLTATNNLGTVLRTAGKPAAAEEVLRPALARAREQLPEGHPVTGWLTESLADALGDLERFEEAEALHREALASLRASLGAGHSSALVPLRTLAREKLAQGDLDGAEALLREHQELAPAGSSFARSAGELLAEIAARRAAADDEPGASTTPRDADDPR